MIRSKQLHLESKPEYDEIRKSAAIVWNHCLGLMNYYQFQRGYPHAHRDFYFGRDCHGWMNTQLKGNHPLHSQSVQYVSHRYFEAWRSYATHKRRGNTKARPPHKRKAYFTNRWLKSAIRFEDSLIGKHLFLSMGRGRKSLDIQLPSSFDMSETESAVAIDLCYENDRYTLHIFYKTDGDSPDAPGDGVLGVDLGEIHPMVTHDGEETLIFNGRYIRSLYRLRNKVNSQIQSLIAKCQRHSKRYRKLIQRKWKFLHRVDRQIKDALHKHTSKLRDICVRRGIGTIVIGDLKGIRSRMDYGAKANQKLHQWPFAKLCQLLTYKCESAGIKVVSCNEAYTSQTCPACGERRKPTNRNYKCKACGFEYHRDGVGAINIRRKYLGQLAVPVEAVMTPPRGIRLETRLPSSELGISPRGIKGIPSL